MYGQRMLARNGAKRKRLGHLVRIAFRFFSVSISRLASAVAMPLAFVRFAKLLHGKFPVDEFFLAKSSAHRSRRRGAERDTRGRVCSPARVKHSAFRSAAIRGAKYLKHTKRKEPADDVCQSTMKTDPRAYAAQLSGELREGEFGR